jgi:hypothetical protein
MSGSPPMQHPAPLACFDDLMTEDEICRAYPHLLGARELRAARRDSKIAFVTGKKGAVLYRPDWIAT